MLIFKKEKLKKNLDKKVLGVYVPLDFLNYIGLYCIANACSKSFLLGELLTSWETETRKTNDEESLIQQIASKMLSIYSNIAVKKPIAFGNAVCVELTRMGITQENIDKIIKQFLNEKNKTVSK